jgi:large subunit ribosomal protein L23
MKDQKLILIEPLLTEKAVRLREDSNQYVFKVAASANKIEIKKAIAKRFNVKVESLRVVNVKGKMRQRFVRGGRVTGFTSSYKKAYVTLAKDDHLDFLDNV